jgi:hypothetical protein
MFLPLFLVLNSIALFEEFSANKIIDFFEEQLLLSLYFWTFIFFRLDPFFEDFALSFTTFYLFISNFLFDLFNLQDLNIFFNIIEKRLNVFGDFRFHFREMLLCFFVCNYVLLVFKRKSEIIQYNGLVHNIDFVPDSC